VSKASNTLTPPPSRRSKKVGPAEVVIPAS
jgi:hypothetical protein